MKSIFGDFVSSFVVSVVVTGFFFLITFLATGKEGTGWWLTAEELHKIPNTSFTHIDGDEYDLGYKTTGEYMFSFIGMGLSNDGYVMIPSGSKSTYLDIDSERLNLFKDLELLPKSLPEQPKTSFLVGLKGRSFWVFLLWMTGLFTYWWYLAKKARAEFEELLSGVTTHQRNVIEVMGHAARANGKIDDSERKAIKLTYESITDNEIEEERLSKIIDLSKTSSNTEWWSGSMGEKCSSEEKKSLFRAAILVLAADGSIDDSEKSFLSSLASGFKLKEEEVLSVLTEMGLVAGEG